MMTDPLPTAGSNYTFRPSSPSSSYGLSDHTPTPGLPKIEADDLKSSLILPPASPEWLSALGLTYLHIAQNAVRRAVHEVGNRSSTTAVTTATGLIVKDFRMENDEARRRTLAGEMATFLVERLAQIPTRETMRTSFYKHLHELLNQYGFPLDEDYIQEYVNLNLEFACSLCKPFIIPRTSMEIQKTIEDELKKRQKGLWKPWLRLIAIPGKRQLGLDPAFYRLRQHEFGVYNNFSAFLLELPEAPTSNVTPLALDSVPDCDDDEPFEPRDSKSVAMLWSGRLRRIVASLLSSVVFFN